MPLKRHVYNDVTVFNATSHVVPFQESLQRSNRIHLKKIRKYPKIVLVLNLYEMNEVWKALVQFQIFLRISLASHVSDSY